jgi:hypothetical protein
MNKTQHNFYLTEENSRYQYIFKEKITAVLNLLVALLNLFEKGVLVIREVYEISLASTCFSSKSIVMQKYTCVAHFIYKELVIT